MDTGRASPDGAVGLIVVADDSPLNQTLMSLMLTQLGYCHHVVSNGTAAVEFVSTQACAMVMLDLQMPEMGGEDAALAIRRLPGDAGRVPIVFVSGDPVGLENACDRVSGATGTLGKPFRLSELRQLLRTLPRATGSTP